MGILADGAHSSEGGIPLKTNIIDLFDNSVSEQVDEF